MKFIKNVFNADYPLLNRFGPSDLAEEVVLEVKLEFDQFKQINQRSSVGILGLLENLGGFYASLDMMCFGLATFFSARFFIMSFASSLFLLKIPKYQPNGGLKIELDYEKITYTSEDLIWGRKKKLVSMCEDRVDQQLEIGGLLKKINETHLLMQLLKTQQINDLFKFNYRNVINLDDGSNSSTEKEEIENFVEDAVY